MKDTAQDEIELAIHQEAWAIVERIKDTQRIKLQVTVNVGIDGQIHLQTVPSVNLPPGNYAVTLLIEKPAQE